MPHFSQKETEKMKLLNKTFGILLLVVLGLAMCPISSIRAEDDIEDDTVVSEESAGNAGEDVQATEDEDAITSSPFVKTNILFVEPEKADLPAGRLVKLLVGFQNNGTSGFLVEGIEGSFRYPQDFSYYIQNFTGFQYNKQVEAQKEATFEYLFTPSETFSSRQFGLTINLRYKNAEGKLFVNTVFNETVSVVEPEEGLDGETFFLYIFLAAIVVLLAIVAQQFLSKKRRGGVKPSYTQKASSNGHSTSNGVDLQWIPKEHLSSKEDRSPRVSPRQRKANGSSKNGGIASSGNSSNDE